MFYLTVVFLGFLGVTLGNFFAVGELTFAAFGSVALYTAFAIAFIFALDAVLAFLSRRLPQKWFAPLAPFFDVGKREVKLLRFFRVPRWKHRIPEWGALTSFRKNKLASATDADYLGRFLLESNYGVVIHWANAILGFALIAIPPYYTMLGVSIPVALVNLFLSLLPTMILRYNTPALRRVYRRALRKQEREERV